MTEPLIALLVIGVIALVAVLAHLHSRSTAAKDGGGSSSVWMQGDGGCGGDGGGCD
jgi:hypothetical protein